MTGWSAGPDSRTALWHGPWPHAPSGGLSCDTAFPTAATSRNHPTVKYTVERPSECRSGWDSPSTTYEVGESETVADGVHDVEAVDGSRNHDHSTTSHWLHIPKRPDRAPPSGPVLVEEGRDDLNILNDPGRDSDTELVILEQAT
jgi:hypothetical protein